MRAQVAASGVAGVSGWVFIKTAASTWYGEGCERGIGNGPQKTSGRCRVVFCSALAIHLAGPQPAAPLPGKPTMSYALVALFVMTLTLAGAAAMLASLQRSLRGLSIPLTSYF
jgi:hypothetical protein